MAFAGFDKTAPQFFFELAMEMNKEWFEANKQRYQDQWVTPMTELLEGVSAKIAKAYAPQKLAPPKLFRIYRDVRFSKEKTPYKTHIAGLIPLGTKKPVDGGVTALYFHSGLDDDEYCGAGTYFFDPSQTKQWRKRVVADASGKPLAALIAKTRKAGLEVGGHDDYKRVPKGLDPEHPRADLLKMRGLTAAFGKLPKGMLHKPALVDWLAERATKAAPLVRWLSLL